MAILTPLRSLPAALRQPAVWWACLAPMGIALLTRHPVACPACGQDHMLYFVASAHAPGHVLVSCSACPLPGALTPDAQRAPGS